MSSCNHLIESADSCCFPVLYSSYTPENTAPPGIPIAAFVVLLSFLVLISTYVLVSSCLSTSYWNAEFWYEEAAALHHSCRSHEQSCQVPCSCASPLCRARLWTSPFMSPQPKVQPLCFWFSANSAAAANPCWATGLSEERSSPFFFGAGAPPVLSTDHELPKLRPPFASVLQQQFIGCSFSTFYQFFTDCLMSPFWIHQKISA